MLEKDQCLGHASVCFAHVQMLPRWGGQLLTHACRDNLEFDDHEFSGWSCQFSVRRKNIQATAGRENTFETTAVIYNEKSKAMKLHGTSGVLCDTEQ